MSTINSAHISRKVKPKKVKAPISRKAAGKKESAANLEKVLLCVGADATCVKKLMLNSGFGREYIFRSIKKLKAKGLIERWCEHGESGRLETFVKLV